MRAAAAGLITACVAGSPAAALAAEDRLGQLNADIRESLTDVRFSYRLRDRDGTSHRLRFSLPRNAVLASRERFRAYDAAELRDLATRDATRQLRTAVDDLGARYPDAEFTLFDDGSVRWQVGSPTDFAARQQQIFADRLALEVDDIRGAFPDARISLETDGRMRIQAPDAAKLRQVEQRLEVARQRAQDAAGEYARLQTARGNSDVRSIRSDIAAAIDTIQRHLDGFKAEYFRERLYRLSDNGLLYPDYARLAAVETEHLGPLAEAVDHWSAGLDRRETLNRLLLFVQSIPYDPLQERSSDTGFLPPLQVLEQNRGDCDSKSVLFAAVAHRLFPDLALAMVLIPRHAYLAVGLEPEPGDTVLTYDGRRWTVAEPVGPGLLRLGQLSSQSRGDDAVIEAVVPLFR